MRIADQPQTIRPGLRERALIFGVDALADIDLLTLVIGTGAEGRSAASIALGILDDCGLEGLGRLGPHRLAARPGIGPAKAARIAAAVELGHRSTVRLLAEDRIELGSVEAVTAWATPRLAGLDHEEVWVLAVDGRNALRRAERVARGGVHGCALTARDVLRPAVRDAATAFVLVHNHPSGDPEPSPDDVEMTRALARAAEVIGIPLLDHVIVAREGATSLLDLGVLP